MTIARPWWCALLIASACASDTPRVANQPRPLPPVTAPDPDAWRSGEAMIREAQLRHHVELLSADDFEGRATLTPGADRAARYLADRFAEYGLRPLPGHAGYRVDYALERRAYDPAATALRWHRAAGAESALRPGVDFEPLEPTEEGAVEAPIVFGGYGIKSGAAWDDYAGLEVKGKIVLLLRHTPREKDAKPPLRSGEGAFQLKAAAAAARGAAGMIVVTDSSHERDESMSLLGTPRVPPDDAERAKEARDEAAEKAAKAKGGAKRPFLSVLVTRAAADQLLSGAGTTVARLQKSIDAGVKPRRLRLGPLRASVAIRSAAAPTRVTADNVVGFLPGRDPARRDEWVVIGGHYDHLGLDGLDGDAIHNGADDNASGTAAVLEMARAFGSLPERSRPARSIVFVGFSGEEMGLLGSRAMLAERDLPRDRLAFMLNLDMIGRNPEKKVEILGDAFATDLRQVTETANADLGVAFAWSGTSYSAASDHHPFFEARVPVMFFFTGTHKDYHQPTDSADKLDYGRMEKLTRLGFRVAGAVASGAVSPRFIQRLLWLGVAVEVAPRAGHDRAVLTEVEPGSRATRLGLAAGDVIVALGPTALADGVKVAAALDAIEPGSKTPVRIQRGATTVAVVLERGERGYLGIMPGDLEEPARAALGLADGEGLVVASVVEGGPAATAGVADGDVLVQLDGKPVGGENLFQRLSQLDAGTSVKAVVIRAGKRRVVDLTLGAPPRRRR